MHNGKHARTQEKFPMVLASFFISIRFGNGRIQHGKEINRHINQVNAPLAFSIEQKFNAINCKMRALAVKELAVGGRETFRGKTTISPWL
jgi:hypothetical protein